jgi:hypothetical protein
LARRNWRRGLQLAELAARQHGVVAHRQLAGYRVLRLAHRRLHDEPAQALRTVRALLEA